jgi:uncharacterized membrane protein
MAITAAKTVSQVATHMAVAFAIAFALTGSVMFSGLAVLIEPLVNVALLPLHQRAWHAIRRQASRAERRYLLIAGEKLSQTGMHMAVAFAVMYGFTGSLVFGGVAAVLEPVCNVTLLPFHDQAWETLRERINGGQRAAA